MKGNKMTADRMRTMRGTQSQEAFCAQYGISVKTYRDWEQGRGGPRNGALMWMHLIERHPKLAAVVATGARGK